MHAVHPSFTQHLQCLVDFILDVVGEEPQDSGMTDRAEETPEIQYNDIASREPLGDKDKRWVVVASTPVYPMSPSVVEALDKVQQKRNTLPPLEK